MHYLHGFRVGLEKNATLGSVILNAGMTSMSLGAGVKESVDAARLTPPAIVRKTSQLAPSINQAPSYNDTTGTGYNPTIL